MSKELKDFSGDELVELLKLKETDLEILNSDGINLTYEEVDEILDKLQEIYFGDVRGHILVEGIANISYSSNTGGRKCRFYYTTEDGIDSDNIRLKVLDMERITFYLSSSNWIDFIFETGDKKITMVLVP